MDWSKFDAALASALDAALSAGPASPPLDVFVRLADRVERPDRDALEAAGLALPARIAPGVALTVRLEVGQLATLSDLHVVRSLTLARARRPT